MSSDGNVRSNTTSEVGENPLDGKEDETVSLVSDIVKRTVDDSDDHQDDRTTSKRARLDETEVLDLATTLGFKPGDRLEVQWEVCDGDGETSETRWWGATLMEHDGRTEDSVAIRVLDYDPYPEGGFPDRSLEDVIFIGSDLLCDPHEHREMFYRRENQDEEVFSLSENEIEEFVNNTLMSAFNKQKDAFDQLDRAKQAVIADKIAQKKKRLLDLMKDFRTNNPNTTITHIEMQSFLAQMMQT
jgi:hypothetical protein